MKVNESEHSNQALNSEDVVQVSKDQTQDTAANHDDLYSTGVLYSWKLKHVAIQHTGYLITDFYQPSN
jgi:hypothetical protein